MLKKSFLLILAAFISQAAFAQSANDVYNQYLDFNLARLQGETSKVLTLGEAILPNAGELPEKARISFYFSIGKMYEDNKQFDNAMPYYEKVAVAVPDYYVVHRALGYLYLEQIRGIEDKLNASVSIHDKKANDRLTIAYNDAARKALPQLEKAQACDPSDETLAIIKRLYRNIKDSKGLDSLDSRLKDLSKHCIDILDDK